MKLKGVIKVSGKVLEQFEIPVDTKIVIEYDAEYTLEEITGMFDLAKRAPELIDVLAEGARKFLAVRDEFKELDGQSEPDKTETESAPEAVTPEQEVADIMSALKAEDAKGE